MAMESFAGPTSLSWSFKGDCRKAPEPFNTLPTISLMGGESLIRSQIQDIESEIGSELYLVNPNGDIDRRALIDVHDYIKSVNERQTRAAKAICRSCVVREECLDWAIDKDEPAGVWGGLTEKERNKLKRHRFRIAS
jgi:hypothetical protein